MARRAIRYGLALAAFCSVLALRIGPARAVALFGVVVAIVALAIGAYLAFLVFWWPDTNGENWFSRRNRRP